VRALEVIELTGEPFIAEFPDPVGIYPTVRIGLEIPRDVLDERIAQRVDAMFDAGLIDEVHRLDAAGLRQARTASRALGYSQVLAMIDGDMTEQQAREDIILATRRFARRQQRWFRRDTRIRWIDYDSVTAVEEALSLWETST
jgi:tRNA dimethylallyltransferase